MRIRYWSSDVCPSDLARTIPTAFVHRYLAFSPDNDVDLSGALRAAGIDLETLSDPRAPLTPTQVTTFIQSTWQITDVELFGLGSSEERRVGKAGGSTCISPGSP